MATVVMQGLTINGAEILVSWVNGFAKANLIKYQGDLIYWGRLAKERSKERHFHQEWERNSSRSSPQVSRKAGTKGQL